nr:sulfite exporter TauE/SafE family protein [Candidatus Photodesmus katoptron]
MDSHFLIAFLIGLLSAGHCIGMCSGIASFVSMHNDKPSNKFIPVYYNLGRLCTYSLLGAIVGGTISSVANIINFTNSLAYLRLAASFFLIALSLYLGRWWFGLLYIEKSGKTIWKYIIPLGKKILPLRTPIHAFPFGFIWGWLPCGLVYSTLTWSALSGGIVNGALVMFCFGSGTLPAMLLIPCGSNYIKRLQQSKFFQQLGAVIILFYGIYTGYQSIRMLIYLNHQS